MANDSFTVIYEYFAVFSVNCSELSLKCSVTAVDYNFYKKIH